MTMGLAQDAAYSSEAVPGTAQGPGIELLAPQPTSAKDGSHGALRRHQTAPRTREAPEATRPTASRRAEPSSFPIRSTK
jgi:hypothetical protein